MDRNTTTATVLAVMQVLVLLVAPVAATAPTTSVPTSTALQTDDGDVKSADTIYVKPNGDAVLAYDEDDASTDTASLGVNVTNGLVHLLVATETDGQSNVTGDGSLVVTPQSLAGNGSFAAPRPESLEHLSFEASGVTNDERSRFDATLDATLDSQKFGATAYSSANTSGHVSVTADSFATKGRASLTTAFSSDGETLLRYGLRETDGGYVLSGAKKGTVSSYQRDQWKTREAAKSHLEQRYAGVARQLGGSATVTIDRYDFEQTDGRNRFDVAYTVEYEGVEEGVCRALTTQLANAQSVNVNESQSRAVADDVKKLTLDHANVELRQSGGEMRVSWDATVEDYDDVAFATLRVLENTDSEETGLRAQDLERARKTLQAQQAANLEQNVTWQAEMSQSSGTTSVEAEVHYRSNNWDAYAREMQDRGVELGSTSFEAAANSDGDEVTASVSFEMRRREMLERGIDSVLSSANGGENSQAKRFFRAFEKSEFQKARMDVNVREGTVTLEAGAKFDNVSALRDTFDDGYGSGKIAAIAARSNESTERTYVYVENLVSENATKEDVRQLSVADGDTTVRMPGEWDREFPSMDRANVASYLGVQYASDATKTAAQNAATTGSATGESDVNAGEVPGFGVVGALLALVGAAMLARRD